MRADRPEPEDKEIESIQPEALARIFECLSNEHLKWRLIVNLLALTGARRGEIAGLQWNNVNRQNRAFSQLHAGEGCLLG